MSDIGIPVATLRQMATGQLLRVVHTILTILAEQVEANPPVRGEEAPGTPPGLFVGPTLLGAPDSPEADGNVMDKVGADAPCVADEPEAETLPAGEPSSSSHPSSSTPRVSGPSLPWIDVNDELEWPGGPPKYDPFDRPRSRSPRTYLPEMVSAVAKSPRGQVLQEDESQSALLLTSASWHNLMTLWVM